MRRRVFLQEIKRLLQHLPDYIILFLMFFCFPGPILGPYTSSPNLKLEILCFCVFVLAVFIKLFEAWSSIGMSLELDSQSIAVSSGLCDSQSNCSLLQLWDQPVEATVTSSRPAATSSRPAQPSNLAREPSSPAIPGTLLQCFARGRRDPRSDRHYGTSEPTPSEAPLIAPSSPSPSSFPLGSGARVVDSLMFSPTSAASQSPVQRAQLWTELPEEVASDEQSQDWVDRVQFATARLGGLRQIGQPDWTASLRQTDGQPLACWFRPECVTNDETKLYNSALCTAIRHTRQQSSQRRGLVMPVIPAPESAPPAVHDAAAVGFRGCWASFRAALSIGASALLLDELLVHGLKCVPCNRIMLQFVPEELLVQEISAARLPERMHMRSGHCLSLAKKSVRDVLDQYGQTTGFKIGITANPVQRWVFYERDGYQKMHLLYAADEPHSVAMMEAALIDIFSSEAGCANVATGGEGPPMTGAGPSFVYIVLKDCSLNCKPKRKRSEP